MNDEEHDIRQEHEAQREDFDSKRRQELSRERRRIVVGATAAVAVVAALAVVAYLLFFRRPEEEVPVVSPAPPPAAPAPSPAEEEEQVQPPEPLPPLGASDQLARRLVAGLSSSPALASWLAHEGLMRRFVVVVDNIAEGVNPSQHLSFLAPEEEFDVVERQDVLYIDPASYDRYDRMTNVFVSLDAEGCAEVYRRLEPLIDEAYRELGYPGADFDDTLRRAIVHLLETPVPEEPVEVEPLVVTYEYADEELAGLSPVQRLLLRTGPENVSKLQRKLREIAGALDIPTGRLP